jgi:glycosyltransferase involved in cell wall biosynthesis
MAKFLVIHPNLDIYGGGERVCHHIIKALVAHDQQVQLLAFDFDRARYAEIMGEKLPENIIIHTLGNRAIVEANPPLSVYKRRRNILKLLKKYKETAEYDYTFSTQTISAFETSLFEKGTSLTCIFQKSTMTTNIRNEAKKCTFGSTRLYSRETSAN